MSAKGLARRKRRQTLSGLVFLFLQVGVHGGQRFLDADLLPHGAVELGRGRALLRDMVLGIAGVGPHALGDAFGDEAVLDVADAGIVVYALGGNDAGVEVKGLEKRAVADDQQGKVDGGVQLGGVLRQPLRKPITCHMLRVEYIVDCVCEGRRDDVVGRHVGHVGHDAHGPGAVAPDRDELLGAGLVFVGEEIEVDGIVDPVDVVQDLGGGCAYFAVVGPDAGLLVEELPAQLPDQGPQQLILGAGNRVT